MVVDIVNLSVEAHAASGTQFQAAVAAIQDAVKAGVIVVVAAGNSGPREGSMSHFATLPGVVSVGATDWEGTRVAPFSSRGVRADPRSGPTVVAPGENIISTWIASQTKSKEQAKLDRQFITLDYLKRVTGKDFSGHDIDDIRKSYTVMSGTSMACPYVTAILSKFIEMRKKMNLPHRSEHAIEFLKRAARKIPGYGEHEQGHGFVSDATVQEYLETLQPDDPFWSVQ